MDVMQSWVLIYQSECTSKLLTPKQLNCLFKCRNADCQSPSIYNKKLLFIAKKLKAIKRNIQKKCKDLIPENPNSLRCISIVPFAGNSIAFLN